MPQITLDYFAKDETLRQKWIRLVQINKNDFFPILDWLYAENGLKKGKSESLASQKQFVLPIHLQLVELTFSPIMC